MRILIIGGNGFIGSPLVHELQAGGHNVAVFHRSAESPESTPSLTHIQGDRKHLYDYRAELERFSPEVVVDLILSSGEQARQLMHTAAGIARRVVVISSMDVYRAWGVLHGVEPGPLEPLPLTETSPVRTVRRLYPPEAVKVMEGTFNWLDADYDKIAVEEAVMSHPRLPATILRLPMIYGPGDPLHRFFSVLKRISDGRAFILLPDDFAAWRGPRGYVDNVAHAIALVATSDRSSGHLYNVCEEPSLPELAWEIEIAEHAGWRGRFVALPRDRAPRHLLLPGNFNQHIVASSQCIRTELGYRESVEIADAIRSTILWERRNPPTRVNLQQFDYAAEDAAVAELR